MLRSALTAGLLVGLAWMCGGCESAGPAVYRPGVQSQVIPATHLAGMLGMALSNASACSVAMTDQTNTLTVLAPPNGEVILNGRAIHRGDGIVLQGGQIMVPAELAEQIRPRMRRQRTQRPYQADPPQVRPPVRSADRGLILIDPGHGGRDPGAQSPFGGPDEKELNLDLSLRLRDELAARGFRVQMTRQDDRFLELDERVAIANDMNPDLLISIHANAYGEDRVRGFEVYAARQASSQSLAVAEALLGSIEATGAASRGLKRADFRVIARTNCPAVLIEAGYMTNRLEMQQLSDPGHRSRLARAIADGVSDCLAGSPTR